MLDWLRRALRREGKGVPATMIAWHVLGRPAWSSRDYAAFAREGYGRNAIAYRCVRLISEAAASAMLKVTPGDHPLAALLASPNPEQTGAELFEAFFGHLQVAGNAFLEAASLEGDPPRQLYVLRPDRMAVIPGARGWPMGWEHRVGAQVTRFERDPFTDQSPILHLKLFAPADARPFPYFPARTDLWSDGPAWRLGHWLNGRAGAALLPDVVRDLAARAGDDDVDVDALSGIVAGYVADAPSTARALIEPLMDAFAFEAREHEGQIVFTHHGAGEPAALSLEDVMQTEQGRIDIMRADGADAPAEARVRYIDASRDYRMAVVSARQRDAAGKGVATLDAPMCLDTEAAEAIAQRLLAEANAAIERAGIGLPPSLIGLEPGDRIALEGVSAGVFRVLSIEDARASLAPEPTQRAALHFTPTPAPPSSPSTLSPPDFMFLDLPPLPNAEDDDRPLAAVYASPWPGVCDVLAGPSIDLVSFRAAAERAAISGRLTASLGIGPLGRWDDANVVRASLSAGTLASISKAALLEGGNIFAVENEAGDWEIVQARTVTLTAPGQYQLTGLLRGQQGTEGAMGAAAGARIVMLDQRIIRSPMRPHEEGATIEFVAVASGRTPSDPAASLSAAPWRRIYDRPFSPCHIRGVRGGSGDVVLSWLRRARLGGDSWAGLDPPLGEESESYLVEIVSGGVVIRTFSPASATITYASADQISDFGALPGSLTVRIAQISARFGAGQRRESTIWV